MSAQPLHQSQPDTSQTEADCLFCKIIRGEIPAKRVWQDADVTAFHDISPVAPTHILIVPNRHVASHAETDNPEIFAQLFSTAQKIVRQLGLHDYRLVINNGAGAGQSVFHLHLHLISGRPFTWPPG